MSNQIHELIDQIQGKVTSVKRQLSADRALQKELRAEIASLQSQLAMKNEELEQLRYKLRECEESKKTDEKQNVVALKEQGISNEQIDDLVKEIEYCIAQLKK